MATIVTKGRLFGTGGDGLTIAENMFLNTTSYDEPSTVMLNAAGGTYTNCSKSGNFSIVFTNPASDTTFSFPVHWTEDEVTWYTTQITGTLYHALGLINITTTLVRTAISESINTVGGLCSSAKVNKYAQFCPNGSAPYKLGDFRKYAHNTSGGTYVRYDTPSPIAWKGAYTVRGYASMIFKEITGKPYSASDLQILESGTLRNNTGSLDYTSVYGGYISYASTNPYDTETHETWTVKTQHYYSGSWVDGTVVTFDMDFLGSPFTVVVTSHTKDADTVYITYTSASFAIGYEFKLTAWKGANTATAIQTNSGSPENIEASAGSPWGIGTVNWKIEVYYNLAWCQVAAGSI